MDEKKKFIISAAIPLLYVILLWGIRLYEYYNNIHLFNLGVLPGSPSGLIGIITGPLIHADMNHLLSNSMPLILLGCGIIYFYWNSSRYVIPIIYFGTGLLDWLFARHAYHIGSSGIVYGMVTFLFFSGVIKRDTRAITLALVVTFLYGSLVWGILPVNPVISWESHLFGSFLGIICAYIFKKFDPYKKYDWEDEEKEVDENEYTP